VLGIRLTGVVIIVGNYGSGKTEVTVNLAFHQKQQGIRVQVADLDLVNPYFRAREARQAFERMGIEVILPPERLMQADLPILMPQVAGLICESGNLVILDVGGDDVGATVLAALQQAFRRLNGPINMMQVINPYRPNTESIEGCLQMRQAIESRARMPVTKWIGNAHMLEETSLEHFRHGHDFMSQLQRASGLAVEFITAPHELLPLIEKEQSKWPVLPILRQLVPPWKKAGR
jgi:CobQ/CobB/MinD/ParA nucleotide binding domain